MYKIQDIVVVVQECFRDDVDVILRSVNWEFFGMKYQSTMQVIGSQKKTFLPMRSTLTIAEFGIMHCWWANKKKRAFFCPHFPNIAPKMDWCAPLKNEPPETTEPT